MINGWIMSGDISVLEIKDNKIEILNNKLVPYYFKRSINIETWLEKRAIDSHRTNSRILKKALRLKETDDLNTVLSVNAVSLTDNYWFKSEDESKLKWEDVRFKENSYSLVALKGDISGFFEMPSKTPELTNIGSYEKCWKLENGQWWIYKHGSKEEIFSELFIYNLGKELGFRMAKYEYDNENYIKSLDFTNGNEVNFESMYSLVGDNDDYNNSFLDLQNLETECKEDILKDYLRMIYLDSICLNVDRHTQNYGILRNKETGKILALAPNFDNNIALISRGYPKDITRENDGLIKFLFEFFNENKEAYNMFKNLDIPKITEDIIARCFNNIPNEVKQGIDLDFVKKFIINGSKKITGI